MIKSIEKLAEQSSKYIKDFMLNCTIEEKIEKLLEEFGGFDKIQQKQLNYFINNLDDLSKKLQ